MKNLKKVLALGLSAAMALSMFVTGAGAASFSDSADIKTTDAVDMLTALNIIQGNPDGSFKPDATVTRAEMAKMIYVLRTGKDSAASFESTPSTFTDITGHWAAGYIKYAQTMGIIAGKSATQFAPDETVTGTEAAKMLLVTVGYDATKAGLVGAGWDTKTNALAAENNLLDDVDSPLASGLPRQYAAQLIYNAIDAETVTYNANGQVVKTEKTETSTKPYVAETKKVYDIKASSAKNAETLESFNTRADATAALSGYTSQYPSATIVARDEEVYSYVNETETKNETVGEKYLSLKTSIGVLMASGNASLNASFEGSDDVLKINNNEDKDIDEGSKSSFTKVKTDYSDLLGARVKVLYKDTDDVLGVYATSDNATLKTVKGSDIDDYSGEDNKIKIDGSKYTLASDVKFYINNKVVSMDVHDFDDAADNDFEVVAISNDGDEKIDVVRLETKSFAKISSLSSSTLYYKTYEDGAATSTNVKVDIEDDEPELYDGIAKDDYVFVGRNYFADKVAVEKATKITGTASSKKDGDLKIDDQWYSIKHAKASGATNNWKVDSKYDMYVYGTYAYLVEGASGSELDSLLVKSVGDVKSLDKGVEAKIVTEEGKEEVVNVKKLILDASKDVDDAHDGTNVITYDDATTTKGDKLKAALETAVGSGSIFMYDEDDGDYTLKVFPAKGSKVLSVDDASDTKYVADRNIAWDKDAATLGDNDIANDAVVYIRYNNGDDFKVMNGKAFKAYNDVAANSNTIALYDTSDKDYIKVAFVDYGAKGVSSGDDLYAVVTSTYESKASDSTDKVTYFELLTEDGKLSDVESDKKYTGFSKGDIIVFQGSMEKMENVKTVSEAGGAKGYGAVKDSDGSRVTFNSGLVLENGDAAYSKTGKINSDTTVIVIDQKDSWKTADKMDPTSALELLDDAGNEIGYKANVYAYSAESNNTLDLLVYEVNNEIQDTKKKVVKLYNAGYAADAKVADAVSVLGDKAESGKGTEAEPFVLTKKTGVTGTTVDVATGITIDSAVTIKNGTIKSADSTTVTAVAFASEKITLTGSSLAAGTVKFSLDVTATGATTKTVYFTVALEA